ncbi:uncharacterized protein LOC142340016 isoform X2 [Convolutriloba macropyga]|uniref:uncharacterized protein LOC142340016 isoform X2 n=1 Tax=Convolutriloba macropyga TaxID=536237 RepID=UPI003F520868
MSSFDNYDDSKDLQRNIRSNFGRKVGEPELVGDDLTLWSKYYHRSYGKGGASNSFYRDVYGADATDMAVKQKTVLGQMRDMKQVLSTDRTKLLDYAALLEDQYDTLYRMSRDPYYEFLLLKHPNYRDTRSYFPRRKEVNERLSKLDAFYAEKVRWAEENAMVKRNQNWLESYLRQREMSREKPKHSLNQIERSLEEKVSETSIVNRRRAEMMRHKFESEADLISSQIARENMLRHPIAPRL